MDKICKICKEEKANEEFYKRYTKCITCVRKQKADLVIEKRAKLYKELSKEVKTKICKICKFNKAISHFTPYKTNVDGFNSSCSYCVSKRKEKKNKTDEICKTCDGLSKNIFYGECVECVVIANFIKRESMLEVKRCNICFIEKELVEFREHYKAYDGRCMLCKQCMKI